MSLIDKIRKARETNIDVEGHTFTIRRPTDEEALDFSGDNVKLLSVVKNFTIGWDLSEIDIIPGGTSEKVPFDSALFGEWVADQPLIWEPLGSAIINAYKVHSDKREAALKN